MEKKEIRNERISLRNDLNANKNWCPMQRGGKNKRRWRTINRLRHLSDDWIDGEIPNSSADVELLEEYKK